MAFSRYLIILKLSLGLFQYFIFKDNKSQNFTNDEKISIQAGSLSSKKAIIPFGYNKLEICNSFKNAKIYSLGEIITGEELFGTNYFANINKNKSCEILCSNLFTESTVNSIKKLIKKEYFSNWYIDNLPAALLQFNKESKEYNKDYFKGIPLGFQDKKNNKFYIYNHFQFHILINKIKNGTYNIVGFNILPLSIEYNSKENECVTDKENGIYLLNEETQMKELKEGNITFKYDIIFKESSITLQTRWENYRKSQKIFRWAGLIYSNILIIIFSIIIFVIFSKNLQKDIDIYNFRVAAIESIDEFNWKNISGDVFRAPTRNPLLFSCLIGTGIQLLLMLIIAIILSLFSYMSPNSKVNFINFGILSFYIMGIPGGYVSQKIYRFFGGMKWIKTAIITSLLFPGSLIIIYSLIDLTLAIEKSNAAIGIQNIIILFLLWIFIFTPLTLLGSFIAAKEKKKEKICLINAIPSLIPQKPFYLSIKFSPFITGFICFGAIYFELNYIMNSLWKNEIYFLAAFLWNSFFIFIIINVEITILVIFWNLNKGEYRWWWKSFFLGASPVIYLFFYSIYYLFSLHLTNLPAFIIYFGIMNIIFLIAFFICGSFSTFMSFFFLLKLYSNIKMD